MAGCGNGVVWVSNGAQVERRCAVRSGRAARADHIRGAQAERRCRHTVCVRFFGRRWGDWCAVEGIRASVVRFRASAVRFRALFQATCARFGRHVRTLPVKQRGFAWSVKGQPPKKARNEAIFTKRHFALMCQGERSSEVGCARVSQNAHLLTQTAQETRSAAKYGQVRCLCGMERCLAYIFIPVRCVEFPPRRTIPKRSPSCGHNGGSRVIRDMVVIAVCAEPCPPCAASKAATCGKARTMQHGYGPFAARSGVPRNCGAVAALGPISSEYPVRYRRMLRRAFTPRRR